MTPRREIQKKYGFRAIAAAILLGGSLIAADLPDLGKGLIAGALFSVLNFILMAESLAHRLGKSRPRAAIASFRSMVPRFALMAVPLVLSLKFHLFHPAAAVTGLFAVQLVILFEHVVSAFTSSADGSA